MVFRSIIKQIKDTTNQFPWKIWKIIIVTNLLFFLIFIAGIIWFGKSSIILLGKIDTISNQIKKEFIIPTINDYLAKNPQLLSQMVDGLDTRSIVAMVITLLERKKELLNEVMNLHNPENLARSINLAVRQHPGYSPKLFKQLDIEALAKAFNLFFQSCPEEISTFISLLDIETLGKIANMALIKQPKLISNSIAEIDPKIFGKTIAHIQIDSPGYIQSMILSVQPEIFASTINLLLEKHPDYLSSIFLQLNSKQFAILFNNISKYHPEWLISFFSSIDWQSLTQLSNQLIKHPSNISLKIVQSMDFKSMARIFNRNVLNYPEFFETFITSLDPNAIDLMLKMGNESFIKLLNQLLSDGRFFNHIGIRVHGSLGKKYILPVPAVSTVDQIFWIEKN